MPRFSEISKSLLATCDPQLQAVMNEVIKIYDIKVLEGHRSVERQQMLYAQGRTKPGSIVTNIDGVVKMGKHNYTPSQAIDVAPCSPNGSIDWEDREKFVLLGGIVLGVAVVLGVHLRWGGDWDRDMDLHDKNVPMDLPHFEVG